MRIFYWIIGSLLGVLLATIAVLAVALAYNAACRQPQPDAMECREKSGLFISTA